LLSHGELEMVRPTHHPAIYDLDGKELHGLKVRIRAQRDKERGLARHKQREARGKAEPRGKNFPGDAEQPLKRKQVFAAALKRINKELDRLRTLESREKQVQAAHRALALRRAEKFVQHPGAGVTARGGMCRSGASAEDRVSLNDRQHLAGNQGGSGHPRFELAQIERLRRQVSAPLASTTMPGGSRPSSHSGRRRQPSRRS
jgi:hypothetical protein